LTKKLYELFVAKDCLQWRGWLLALPLIALAIVSRHPDLISNPQFFGDESTWYKEAYETGAFHSLLTNQGGYLVIGLKLPNLIAVHAPLSQAPRIDLTYSILLNILCVSFLMTRRLTGLGSFSARLALAFLWIAIPNANEVDTLNSAQWFLAILGILLLLATPPTSSLQKLLDYAMMLLVAFTGPFCMILFAIALALVAFRREAYTFRLLIILGLGCIAQGWILLHHLPLCTPREVGGFYASQVLVAQVFLFGAGHSILTHLFAPLLSPSAMWTAVFATICGLSLLAYATLRSTLSIKLLVAYAAIVFLACGYRLHCDAGWHKDVLLFNSNYAARYWYVERFALLAVFVWMLWHGRPLLMRLLGGAFIVLVAAVSIAHWQYPPWPDCHFAEHAAAFDAAPKGTVASIPVNPGWQVILIKH
jgi:hypothetical protein